MINTRLPNILVPLNKDALTAICSGGRGENEGYKTFPIGRDDLGELFVKEFFDEINSMFNLNIDEYEEEIIFEEEIIIKLNEYLINRLKSEKDVLSCFYIKKIIECIKESLKYKCGLGFYF